MLIATSAHCEMLLLINDWFDVSLIILQGFTGCVAQQWDYSDFTVAFHMFWVLLSCCMMMYIGLLLRNYLSYWARRIYFWSGNIVVDNISTSALVDHWMSLWFTVSSFIFISGHWGALMYKIIKTFRFGESYCSIIWKLFFSIKDHFYSLGQLSAFQVQDSFIDFKM